MPKKTRKMKQRAAMRRSVSVAPQPEVPEETESVVPVAPTLSARPILSASASNRAVTPATYDYSHIYSDLKRIAAFAAFFFAALIVLSFVIK
jgi:hypothetical protein